MKLIMENWRDAVAEDAAHTTYLQNRAVLLSDPQYVTEVLGVQIPLTEAYPWSPTLTEQIIQEQLLFEAFWDPVVAWGKAKAGDAADKVKEMAQSAAAWGKDFANTMLMIYKAIAGGKLRTYMKGLMRTAINPVKNLLFGFLDLLINKGPEWGMPTFAKWAEKTKQLIESGIAGLANLDGWKKALGLTTLALGLAWVKNQIGEQVEGIIKVVKEKLGFVYDIAAGAWSGAQETVTEVDPRVSGAARGVVSAGASAVNEQVKEAITKLVQEKVKGAIEGILGKALSAASAAYGNVTEWVNQVKKIFGGMDFVKKALASVLSFFAARGGMNENILIEQNP